MASIDPRTRRALDVVIGDLWPLESASRSECSSLSEFLPEASYISLGFNLSRNFWAEVSSYAGQGSRRVAIRRQDRCAAGMAAQRATEAFGFAEGDRAHEYRQTSLTDNTWEDYQYASRVSGAQHFVSLAFHVVPERVDDMCLSTVPFERRIFTITVGAVTLPSKVHADILKLGHALPSVLAPHFANLLASLDLFVFHCMTDMQCGEHRVAAPANCHARFPPGPDADAAPSAQVTSSGPADSGVTEGGREGVESAAETFTESAGKTNADVVSPSALDVAAPSLSMQTTEKCPAALASARAFGRSEACKTEDEPLTSGALGTGVADGSIRDSVSADGEAPGGESHMKPPCSLFSQDVALWDMSGCADGARGGLRERHGGKRAVVGAREDRDWSAGFWGWLNPDMEIPADSAIHADLAKLKDNAKLDVAQDPFWLTFRSGEVEHAYQTRTAGKSLLVHLDEKCMILLLALWLTAGFTESFQGEGSLLHQAWYPPFTAGLCAIMLVMSFLPSWYVERREFIVLLLKFIIRLGSLMYLRSVRELEPDALPGKMLKHAVVVPVVYLMKGVCMPVSFRWGLPYQALGALLALGPTWVGCSRDSFTLQHAALRFAYGAGAFVVGDLAPLCITRALEKKNRADFMNAAFAAH